MSAPPTWFMEKTMREVSRQIIGLSEPRMVDWLAMRAIEGRSILRYERPSIKRPERSAVYPQVERP